MAKKITICTFSNKIIQVDLRLIKLIGKTPSKQRR